MMGLELVKWLALLLMTGDHVNVAVYGYGVPWLWELGRVVFPLFAFVFAFNMARPGRVYGRTLQRLVLWTAIATVPHGLVFGWFPLNILGVFAVAVACMWAIDAQRYGVAAAVVLLGGVLVEASWPGVGLVLGSWWWFRARSFAAATSVVLCLASIAALQGSFSALAAVPVFLLGVRLPWPVPRLRWAFLGYYPAHLAVLAVLGV